MRLRNLSFCALTVAVPAAGFLTGRVIANGVGTGQFDVREWPTRGAGPRLVEYFDPECAASRAFHVRVVELLEKIRT
jgi:hypothetical protein